MTAVDTFVNKPFHLALVGGEDFEFSIGLFQQVKTSLDGKTTALSLGPPFDFTGWSQFYAVMAPDIAEPLTRAKTLSLVIDGDPRNGELRLFGRGVQTWDLQAQGYRAGILTLAGLTPAGQRRALAHGVWDMTVGLVGPSTPYIPDWTAIRA